MNSYLKNYIRILLKEENDENFFEMLLIENIEKTLEKMGLTSRTLDFLNSRDLGKREIAIANYIANEIKRGNWNSNQSEEEQALEVINQYLDELIFMHKELNSIGIMINLRNFKLIEDAYFNIKEEYDDKFGEIKHDEESEEIVMRFPDGFYWIKLNKTYCKEEGEEMQHCGRAVGTNLLSLRNRMGGRHVTIDIDENRKKFMQIKGKNNTKPAEKYFNYIISLLKNKNYSDYEISESIVFSKHDFNLLDLYNYKKDPKIREKILNSAKNGSEYFRQTLARNPNIDKEIQLILANDESEYVREFLAQNPNIDKEIQLILANDENERVRSSLAFNPNIDIDKEIQLILSNHESEYVREFLAQNPNIDKETQLLLANDENIDVRSSLAQNSNIDKEIHLILANDEYGGVRMILAQNPNIDKEIQLILADDEYRSARVYLAQNPNIDKEIQLILANDEYGGVRMILAQNPNIDPEIRRMIEL